MQELILLAGTTEALESLKQHAEAHPFSMDDLLDMMNKHVTIAGDRPEYVRHLPLGYRVVYSVENQVKGTIRHLSVSVDVAGKYPSIGFVREIMHALGFQKELEQCRIEKEQIGPTRTAINVIEIATNL